MGSWSSTSIGAGEISILNLSKRDALGVPKSSGSGVRGGVLSFS